MRVTRQLPISIEVAELWRPKFNVVKSKFCPSCQEAKPINETHWMLDRSGKPSPVCRACIRERERRSRYSASN